MITRIHTTTRRATAASAALLAALTFGLAGCGGDDGAGVRDEGTTSQSSSGEGTGSEGGSSSE